MSKNNNYTKTELLNNGWTETLIKKWLIKHDRISYTVREDKNTGEEYGVKCKLFNATRVNAIEQSAQFLDEFPLKPVKDELENFNKNLKHNFKVYAFNRLQCEECNSTLNITRNKIVKYFVGCDNTCNEMIIKKALE